MGACRRGACPAPRCPLRLTFTCIVCARYDYLCSCCECAPAVASVSNTLHTCTCVHTGAGACVGCVHCALGLPHSTHQLLQQVHCRDAIVHMLQRASATTPEASTAYTAAVRSLLCCTLCPWSRSPREAGEHPDRASRRVGLLRVEREAGAAVQQLQLLRARAGALGPDRGARVVEPAARQALPERHHLVVLMELEDDRRARPPPLDAQGQRARVWAQSGVVPCLCF